MRTPRIVITAGFDRAPHVFALAELLRRRGVIVEGLITVSPYNWKRLRALTRQRGREFLWQAIPRLLGKGLSGSDAERPDALSELMGRHKISPGSLRAWSGTHQVPYCVVPSINDKKAVEFVRSINPDWVVYGGGGILRNPFIDAAEGRILNAHSGPMPEVRGMNACEWSLLLGYAPVVTIHLINRGIDTGGIIARHPVPVCPGDTIEMLRSRCVAVGVEAMLHTVLNPPEKLPQPERNAASHRQCFVLAPALKELLARRLAGGTYAHFYEQSSEEGASV